MGRTASAANNTPRKAGRPVGSNREDSLARILPVARRLFAERGYAKTTFKEIAGEVGVTPAALYAYFPSKADLYRATCDHTQALMLEHYVQVMAEGGSLREKLGRMLRLGAVAHEEDPSITGLLGAIPMEARRHPEVADLLQELRNSTHQFMVEAFADAQRQGEINDHSPAEHQAITVMGAAVGMALFQYGLQQTSIAETTEVFIQMLEGELFT